MSRESKIFPFRNVQDQSTPADCEICGEEIEPFTGYAVVGPNKVVDGYVCQQCFELGEECEDKSVTRIVQGLFFTAYQYDITTIN